MACHAGLHSHPRLNAGNALLLLPSVSPRIVAQPAALVVVVKAVGLHCPDQILHQQWLVDLPRVRFAEHVHLCHGPKGLQ